MSATIRRSMPSGRKRNDESRMPKSRSPKPPSVEKKAASWRTIDLNYRFSTAPGTGIFGAMALIGKALPFGTGVSGTGESEVPFICGFVTQFAEKGTQIAPECHNPSAESCDCTKADSRT